MPNNNDFASNPDELSLELVRMAQSRVNEHGVGFAAELARLVAEAAILALPVEDSYLIDQDLSISQSNVLAAAVGVNDLVVNGRHIDIRPLEADQSVALDRVLIGTPYLAHGSLVVKLHESSSTSSSKQNSFGQVIGYVTPNAWLKADAENAIVRLPVTIDAKFDLSRILAQIVEMPTFKLPSISKIGDLKKDLYALVNERESLISARQKQIFAYISTNWAADVDNLLPLVESVPVHLSTAKMRRIVSDASFWNAKVERLVGKLAARFPDISSSVLHSRILQAGELHGSQLGAPRYRRALLAELIALEMSAKNAKSSLAGAFSVSRAQALVEKVLSGDSALEAVKHVIGNQVAVDLAYAIKKQRHNLQKAGTSAQALVAATAEELGFAYGQLALQPAYATHSQGDQSGIDSVNEALALFAASDLAGDVKNIEMEIANL